MASKTAKKKVQGAEGPKQKYYIAQVIQEFESKKDAETFINEHDLGEDELILKGKSVEPRNSVRL